ncbi:MAG: dipeptide/oligopeptide/nickel transporter ATP-binding protein [Pseudonocardiales bacterium]|nr:dipeptide/oligopeptide/nickel transporter ATP-binding protein [Pseudonocardiales bacterium]
MVSTLQGLTHTSVPTVTDDVLVIDSLSVTFPTQEGPALAVSDVSLTAKRGERIAIVGESGSGKSVFSLAMMGIVNGDGKISGGSVKLNGRDIRKMTDKELRKVRGGEIGMVFQDPGTSLNPVMTVARQMIPPIRRHLGLSKADARARAIQLLAETGIPDPERNLDSYPHQFSGGMRQRVMIAMALSCNPSVLVADEPTTALDVTIQAQIVALLKRLSAEHNSTVIFVTHDMGLVARFADRIAVMYAGKFVEVGNVLDVFRDPKHPYTRGLLASIPAIDGDLPDRLMQIDGTPPKLSDLPRGCSFAPRCPEKIAGCEENRPPLFDCGEDHQAACWLDVSVTVTAGLA